MTTTNPKALVLSLNAGSSSLKASVLKGEECIVSFLAERLTTPDAVIHIHLKDKPQVSVEAQHDDDDDETMMDHAGALSIIIGYLKDTDDMLTNLVAVGHRVVHGGSLFSDSAIVTEESLRQMKSVSHLAPLHNPHNIGGIEVMRKLLPKIPNVAVFDTSFHSSIPVHAYTYPIPKEYREKDMRKFGFHGTSVKYVSQKATELLHTFYNNKEGTKRDVQQQEQHHHFQMIVCHLGNGASVTAVSETQSRETSMGFTPLSGLMMGTRCGDVDPSLVNFAVHALGKDVDQVLDDFNQRSGLKGMMSDGEHDMRVLLARANAKTAANADDHDDKQEEAQLAVDMFVYHLAQHIASCLVALEGPLDALVFTAGIGEHSAEIRRRTMTQLKYILPNATLDDERNAVDGTKTKGVVSKEGAWPLLLDIPTDEEVMIAKECLRLVV